MKNMNIRSTRANNYTSKTSLIHLSLCLIWMGLLVLQTPWSSKHTSVFGGNTGVQSPETLVVKVDKDDGPGSLRNAIEITNRQGGGMITFDLRAFGSKEVKIKITKSLPPLLGNITIDGQNGSIELDGSLASEGTSGLILAGPRNRIHGLMISNFKGNGLVISGRLAQRRADENQISGNFIGTDPRGTQRLGNRGDGIFVEFRANKCQIRNNLIANNGGNGVNISNNGKDSPVGILIDDNLIYRNSKLGIDLGSDGRTLNEKHKRGELGPNNWQKYPVLKVVKPGRQRNQLKNRFVASSLDVNITVNVVLNEVKPDTDFIIKFFYASNECCPIICNECRRETEGIGCMPRKVRVTGMPTMHSDSNGHASRDFVLTFRDGAEIGRIIAQAINENQDSSEFTQCTVVP
ncbi:MAG: right-handed parallel beta-helix repeat-containing protein [Acidobacteriota bacterium]|nr:MAG: right-handed parallel beta-helix repeat-containing protein [Acidobacteriota bacterium]